MRRKVDDTPVHNRKNPEGWLSIHREHGRGPYFEVKIGEWNIWRCPCGEKFHFTEAQRDSEPEKYVIT